MVEMMIDLTVEELEELYYYLKADDKECTKVINEPLYSAIQKIKYSWVNDKRIRSK